MNTALLLTAAKIDIIEWLIIFILLVTCIFITRAVFSIPAIVHNLSRQSELLSIIADHYKKQPIIITKDVTPEMQLKIDAAMQQHADGILTKDEYNSIAANIISGR